MSAARVGPKEEECGGKGEYEGGKMGQEKFEINCSALETRTAIRGVRASKRQPSAENSPDEPVRHIKFRLPR